MNTNARQTKGFTIIEVVLVLAIAALIFLMVFVALPALQASQRDTARKNDASLVNSSVTKFTSAYKRAPAATDTDRQNLREYIDDLDQYDKGDVDIRSSRDDDPSKTQIYVYPQSECNGPDAVASENRRKLAVRIQLEDDTFYCLDAS